MKQRGDRNLTVRELDELDRIALEQPPAAPDGFVCPVCGETYPGPGGCYGADGSHGWVVLRPSGMREPQ